MKGPAGLRQAMSLRTLPPIAPRLGLRLTSGENLYLELSIIMENYGIK